MSEQPALHINIIHSRI